MCFCTISPARNHTGSPTPCPTPTMSTPDGLVVWTRHSSTCSQAPIRVHTERDKIEPVLGRRCGRGCTGSARCE